MSTAASSFAERQTVYVIDDHEIIRSHLGLMITNDLAGYESVGSSDRADTAIQEIKDAQPSILVLDLMLKPDDWECPQTVESVRMVSPHTKILIYTSATNVFDEKKLIAMGVDGILFKASRLDEIRNAFIGVLKATDKPYIHESVKAHARDHQQSPHAMLWDSLSPTEKEVFKLISKGFGRKEISEKLEITNAAFDTYRSRAVKKYKAAVKKYKLKDDPDNGSAIHQLSTIVRQLGVLDE